MIHAAPINVLPLDDVRRIDLLAKCALSSSRACFRSIEHCEGAVGSAQKPMIHIVRISGISRHRPAGVESAAKGGRGALKGTRARPRTLECGNVSVTSAQEAVGYVARIDEDS